MTSVKLFERGDCICGNNKADTNLVMLNASGFFSAYRVCNICGMEFPAPKNLTRRNLEELYPEQFSELFSQ